MSETRPPRTYTAKEIADFLKMPVTEVYRDGANGTIPGRIRIGGRTRFSGAIIDEWLSGGEEAA